MKDYVLKVLSDIYGERREGLCEYGLSEAWDAAEF